MKKRMGMDPSAVSEKDEKPIIKMNSIS